MLNVFLFLFGLWLFVMALAIFATLADAAWAGIVRRFTRKQNHVATPRHP